MIYLISDRNYPTSDHYQQISMDQFYTWFKEQLAYQLDTETNMVDDLTDRELYVVQIGSIDLQHQFVFDYAGLTKENQSKLIWCLNDRSKQKLVFNASFEYPVLKWCCSIDLANIYDVFLTLKKLLNGKNVPKEIFSLKGALKEYLDVDMSKEEQTSFTGDPLTVSQIYYAALDVYYLVPLLNYIKENFPDYAELEEGIALENEVIRGFGDIMYYGFVFDKDKWEENLAWARPQVEKAKNEIFKIMRGEELLTKVMNRGFVRAEDEITLNWKSSKQKTAILERIYPDMEKYTQPHLKVKEKTLPDGNLLEFLLNRKYDEATLYVKTYHLDLLKELGYYKPAGEITVNLNSPKQRLKLFQLVEPQISDTRAETLKKCKHPMIKAYSDYISKQKMVQSYGENFYEFIGNDGRIRPRFVNPILSTGRVAISQPGIQTVPADEVNYREYPEAIGDRYREAFVAQDGWSIVASDYDSQELAVIAYLADEQSWIDAIREGKDLHSMNAYRMFGQKWIDAGGDPNGQGKPKAKEAKRLRTYSKTISFGLAYGAGPALVAERLGISKAKAKELITQFFNAFPNIKRFLDQQAEFGANNGYVDIGTGKFNGRRYFGAWNTYYVPEEDMASIERQSKNTSIQGGSAIATKVAMVLIKNYIEENNLQDRVHLVMMLHDAVVTEARDDFKDQWAPIMTQLMEEGHNYLTPGNLVTADTPITKTWTK